MSNNMDVDRISLLPDSLLLDILSSLDTKQVVQTCVLSKPWKTLWTRIPTLDFDYNSYIFEEHSRINGMEDAESRRKSEHLNSKEISLRRSFQCFISGVLSEHRSEYIKKLSYSFTRFDEYDFMTKLLCYEQCRKAQELCLMNYVADESMWSGLSACKFLTVLKVTCKDLNNLGFLVLPSLRTLVLRRKFFFSMFYIDDMPLNEKTFLGCPNLESLALTNCIFLNALISAPKLENLELVCAVQHILALPDVELYTPNLKSFKIRNAVPFVKPASELVYIYKVSIAIDVDDFKRETYINGGKMETNISQLFTLFGNVVPVNLPPNETQEFKRRFDEKTIGVPSTSYTHSDFFYFPDLTYGIYPAFTTTLLSQLNMSDLEDVIWDFSSF